MLDGIFQVLADIGSFFASVVDAILGFIDNLVSFVEQLLGVGQQIGSILGGFPVFFITGVLLLVALMVVLRVVGRD